jgi:uncharacterized repeat protein (TIGR01451 family)
MRPPAALALLIAAAAALPAAAVPTIGGCQVFPADNYWNTPVDTLAVHASSATWVGSVGTTAKLHADWGNVLSDNYGIPFITVPGSQPLVPFTAQYADESDPGPYPIPPSAPIEGGPSSTGDRHVLVIDTTNCVLYELYSAYPQNGGTSWDVGSAAKFPLASNALRPAGWTSADAAGLPIFPGLVRYDEAATGTIEHAIRFTANHIWGSDASGIKYLWPARHNSGTTNNASYPPMGARFRLKASYTIPTTFTPVTQAILRAMKKYGLVLADGGSNWYFQGVSDTRWPDAVFSELGSVAGSNFEVVDTSALMINANSAQSRQAAPSLAITQAASPSLAVVGKDVALTVTVTNSGAGPAMGAVITDQLPASAAFIWASPGCTVSSGNVSCGPTDISGGGTYSFKVVLRPAIAGFFGNVVNAPTASTSLVNVTVNAAPAGVPTLRYRLYSPASLEHHYTTDLNEYTVLGASGAWVQEGTVGKVLDNPGSFNGVQATPYYRLYNTITLWHHWTTDPNEYYTLGTFPGWNQEGVDGYILPTSTTGTLQLFRLTYPFVGGLHHWTVDPNEYATLTTTYGWVGEGGSGFVIQ